MGATPVADSDLLIDLITRSSMLEALHGDTLGRADLEQRLDVSTTTCYRYLNWLRDRSLADRSNDGITLTPSGEAVTQAVTRFEEGVLTTVQAADGDRTLLCDVVRYAPAFEALADGPRDRRELERQLDVSKTTSYRFARSFEDRGLVEKTAGRYELTAAGERLRSLVTTFETTVQRALRLGPVLDAVADATPAFDPDAFADATVTTTDHGDPYGPVSRCIDLLEETETLRGVYLGAVVPLYISDVAQRILDGMETVNIGSPERIAAALAESPARCLDVCASGNATVYLHDDLSYGLVILDDRVGIGLLEPDTRNLQMFLDTNSPRAREWAEGVFEYYKDEAVRMEGFSPAEVRRVVEEGPLDIDALNP